MIRSFVVGVAVLFLACTQVPEGLCEDASDCLAGLSCQSGVCVGCAGDGECQAWQACSADRRCALREGMCGSDSHCEAWEVCGAGNTCQLAQGACVETADCLSYESCDTATKQCVLQEGRCSTAESCGGSSLWTPTCDAENYCRSSPAEGNDVLLWGTLLEGLCGMDAISGILSPTRVQVGFTCGSSIGERVVAPGGRVIYNDVSAEPMRLKVFVPDSFRVEGGRRSYPSSGPANDSLLPTPGCQATEDVIGFVVQAGTGAIAHACRSSGLEKYYDASGEAVVDGFQPLAWNAQDHMLGFKGFSSLSVLTSEGSLMAVTGLPAGYRRLDARAAPTGFWVAVLTEVEVQQLWRVGHDGVATFVVTYGGFPADVFPSTVGVLDAAGNLYSQTRTREGKSFDVVVRRLADGSPGTAVYSEASAPAKVNGGANYEQLFNLMHGSVLFAGP